MPGSDVQVAVEVHARRDRVRDRGVVPGVDVVVDDRDELDEVDGLERGQGGGARVARRVRAERDDGREPPGAALGHGDGRAPTAPARRSAALEPGRDRDAADQRVLGVEAGQDRPGRSRRGGA